MPSVTGLMTQVLVYAIAAMSLTCPGLWWNGAFGHRGVLRHWAAMCWDSVSAAAERSEFLGLLPAPTMLLIALWRPSWWERWRRRRSAACRCAPAAVPFIMITLAFAQMLFFLFVSLRPMVATMG